MDEVTRAGTAVAASGVLFAMNDQHADGRDVSWYWDVDPTPLVPGRTVAISGSRAPDLLLRLRYQLLDDPAAAIPGLIGSFERPAAGSAVAVDDRARLEILKSRFQIGAFLDLRQR